MEYARVTDALTWSKVNVPDPRHGIGLLELRAEPQSHGARPWLVQKQLLWCKGGQRVLMMELSVLSVVATGYQRRTLSTSISFNS